MSSKPVILHQLPIDFNKAQFGSGDKNKIINNQGQITSADSDLDVYLPYKDNEQEFYKFDLNAEGAVNGIRSIFFNMYIHTKKKNKEQKRKICCNA